MGRPRADSYDTTTEERLLQAAEVEFGRDGFDRARLEDIARSAGITRPSLLYYFASKEQIYAAVVHRAFEGLRGALHASFAADLPFEERLDGTVLAYLDFLHTHPQIAGVLLREVIDGRGPGRDLVLSVVAPMIDLVERFIVKEGRGKLVAGLPVRGALLMIIGSALVQATSGGLRDRLYGPTDDTRALTRSLFFGR